MKKLGTLLIGLTVIALLVVPALAAEIHARIKSVDATAQTITVTEHHQDQTFSVTDKTTFLNAKGAPLANGLASGDLRAGARVAITYDKSVASEIKLRDNAG